MGELAVLGFQFVLFYYGWILTERMGDETAISLPWVKIAWVNSVLPVTGALLLAASAWRVSSRSCRVEPITQGGHDTWSGSSSE